MTYIIMPNIIKISQRLSKLWCANKGFAFNSSFKGDNLNRKHERVTILAQNTLYYRPDI